MRTLLAGLALTVALAAAPASAQSDTTWKRHSGPGFSVSLPTTWFDASKDRARLLAEVRKLYADDAKLARMIDGLMASSGVSGVKMIAFDLDPSSLRSGFATNLNVVREGTNVPLGAWKDGALRSLTAMTFVKQPIWSQYVRLAAGKAIRFRYNAQFTVNGKPLVVSITQYGIVKPGSALVLTYTTLPKLAGAYRTQFGQSAKTLRIG
jgi:hypothetical protein